KFPAKKFQSKGLTPLEKAMLDLHYAHLYVYHQLRQYGPNLFEHDGSIITCDENGKYKRDGRSYIMKIIKFFEAKDRPINYRMCAKLKTVLDDYDAKFVKNENDSN